MRPIGYIKTYLTQAENEQDAAKKANIVDRATALMGAWKDAMAERIAVVRTAVNHLPAGKQQEQGLSEIKAMELARRDLENVEEPAVVLGRLGLDDS